MFLLPKSDHFTGELFLLLSTLILLWIPVVVVLLLFPVVPLTLDWLSSPDIHLQTWQLIWLSTPLMKTLLSKASPILIDSVKLRSIGQRFGTTFSVYLWKLESPLLIRNAWCVMRLRLQFVITSSTAFFCKEHVEQAHLNSNIFHRPHTWEVSYM